MPEKKEYREILETLERAHPGRIFLTPEEFARATGFKVGTIYNQTHAKSRRRIDIPIARPNGRPRFKIHDVARFLADR